LVYWAIVLNGVEFAVFLFDVEESALVRAFRQSDRPSSEVFLDEFSEFLKFSLAQWY